MTLWGTPYFQVLPKNISYNNPIFVAGYGINSMNFYMAAYLLVDDPAIPRVPMSLVGMANYLLSPLSSLTDILTSQNQASLNLVKKVLVLNKYGQP